MLTLDSTGTDVKELQSNLTILGLNPGPIDGIYGQKTLMAVMEFQRLHGLSVTGVFESRTEKKMYEVFNTPAKPQAPEPAGKPLTGRTFIVEAGHGGDDPGAVDGLNPAEGDYIYTKEKDLVLLYAIDFADALRALGATVVIIRGKDETMELAERTNLANKYPQADALISWHANSFTSASASGQEGLVYSNESRAYKLATALREELQKAGVGLHGGGIVERPGLWILKATAMPALMNEIGFISNPAEEKKLHDPLYRKAFISATVSAVVNTYGQEAQPDTQEELYAYQKTRYAGADVHVVKVRNPNVYIAQMEPGTAKVSDMAQWNKAKAAINGGYFYAGNGVVAVTPVIQQHKSIGLQEAQYCPRATFCFGDDGRMVIRQVERAAELTGYKYALGGGPLLVQDGIARVADEGFLSDITQGRAPRTAIGLVDERTLMLVVVEGRSADDAGLTLEQLAALMASQGCQQAMNLDGGGSSTMWVEGKGIVNQVSDGRERPVKNALIIL
jgi:N-acetylmuramoyl-L-alanine amidase/exopolysaccharide biosynthesis protein